MEKEILEDRNLCKERLTKILRESPYVIIREEGEANIDSPVILEIGERHPEYREMGNYSDLVLGCLKDFEEEVNVFENKGKQFIIRSKIHGFSGKEYFVSVPYSN